MKSIKFKILGLTTLILIAAVALVASYQIQTQSAIIRQMATQDSQVLASTIRNGIISAMASGKSSEVADILGKVRNEPSIEAVNIFDTTGKILTSADPEEIGTRIPQHNFEAYLRGDRLFQDEDNSDRYSSFTPIYNAPACHRCHSADTEILGVLQVHTALENLQALQRKGHASVLLSSAGTILALVIALTCFILFYVDKPIRLLVSAMNRVEKGEFDSARTQIVSSVEMNLLADKFNLMVERLRDLIDSKISAERTLATQQEKLSHHEEIRAMNATLEERLKEIEYLNITLEERIEEIEEANFKIADLASDLEDKNRSLEHSVSRLSSLHQMGLALNSTMELSALFELLTTRAVAALKAQVGYILMLDRNAWELKVGATHGLPHPPKSGSRVPLKPGGLCYWIVKNKTPLLIRNIREQVEFNQMSLLGFQIETAICVPLVVKREVVGAIVMANKTDASSFDQSDLDHLSTIAAAGSVAIYNAQLYHEQQDTYLNTVQALVSAIEASDASTRGHSERVTRFSLDLANHIGLPPDAVARLEKAAILHDIGKIGINVAVLHKKGKLTEDEFAHMRQHPAIGARILEPIRFLEGIRNIILQHHERHDGRGYPNGLKGEQLLLEARILAIADTYDAMTSDRPYRKGLPHEIAIQEILDHAGTQFDPQLAMSFIDMFNTASRAQQHHERSAKPGRPALTVVAGNTANLG